MIVLSLFDGMSCGQIALKELGVKIDKYYASEVDKFAIEQTKLNFPNTIHLGDVTKWKEWDIDWSNIDLVIGGSPCQGFSFAGKQLAFDDPRSVLFFEFVDIVNHVKKHNPKMMFLLENVQMAKRHIKVINDYMGVHPVEINSSLVSAQNRVRLYWSNIRVEDVGLFGEKHTDIPQPEDRGVYLKDILEYDVDDKYYFTMPISISRAIAKTGIAKLDKTGRVKSCQNKSSTLTAGANSGGNHSDMDLIYQLPRGCNKGGFFKDKAPTLSSSGWENNNYIITHSTQPRQGKGQGGKGHLWKMDGKSYCLDTGCTTAVEYSGRVRRLTPAECARLQTIPYWYKWECSNTQQYKMLGNGWTVEVIKHIFSFLNRRR